MNPISNTAFYCCGIRMMDAASPRPICGDTYAQRFMDARGREILERFGAELAPNASNVARHRYIDDYLRAKLKDDPKLRVILLGAGFDSRAFRLTGGNWLELDEPALIEYKNEKVPVDTCPNPLRRVPIEFAHESLEAKLKTLVDAGPTVVIIEGVTMYLTAESLESSLKILRALLPRHEIIADLMTKHFAQTLGKSVVKLIAQMGAKLDPLPDPAVPFVRTGYREILKESILLMTLTYRNVGFLRWLVRLTIPRGVVGYTIRVFVPS